MNDPGASDHAVQQAAKRLGFAADWVEDLAHRIAAKSRVILLQTRPNGRQEWMTEEAGRRRIVAVWDPATNTVVTVYNYTGLHKSNFINQKGRGKGRVRRERERGILECCDELY